MDHHLAIGQDQARVVLQQPQRHGLVATWPLKLNVQDDLAPVIQGDKQYLIRVKRIRGRGQLIGSSRHTSHRLTEQPGREIGCRQCNQAFKRVIRFSHSRIP